MTDLIESLLERLHLRTQVFHRSLHCGNWHIDLNPENKVLLHFVSQGSCIIEIPEEDTTNIELFKGDLLLFPRPEKHVLRALSSNNVELEKTTSPATKISYSNTDSLICAYAEFDHNIRNPLFEALPDFVIVRFDAHPDPTWLEHLLGLLFAEAGAETTGSQTVIERLTDILLIHVIRSYLTNCPDRVGFIAAYNDRGLRAVLELMHQSPQKPWSIADFANAANLSRSTFIEKFTRILNMPPMTYLTQQRLEQAHQQLREGRYKIIDIAMNCGYENESSFSKAFKRRYGLTPSSLNRNF